MKTLYLKIAGVVCLYLISFHATSQGCVAIRSGCGANVSGGALLPKGHWQVGSNFRYFHSYKHFRGKHEEKHRVEEGSEVINDSFFLDMLLSYGITNRLALNFVLPFVYHERSSLYEHGGTERHKTYAKGLADLRVSAGYWFLPADAHGNASLNLGVKLPTGAYGATDYFHNTPSGVPEERTVDQSIQPGDGGFGLTVEGQFFKNLGSRFSVDGNLYYLINPREKNGVSTYRSREAEAIMSVPDQFAARGGISYMTSLHGLNAYFGGRFEGIPVEDFIGGSNGFRRPGYVISMEPGVTYSANNFSFNLTIPIAVERNRTKSVPDMQVEKQTGQPRHGDAAFADYLINFGITWRFGKNIHTIETLDTPIELTR